MTNIFARLAARFAPRALEAAVAAAEQALESAPSRLSHSHADSVYRVPVSDRPVFEAVLVTASARIGRNLSYRFLPGEFARVDLPGWSLPEMDLLNSALWKADQARVGREAGWVL
jgi:hypothetical protein